jgi:hypothetical protein
MCRQLPESAWCALFVHTRAITYTPPEMAPVYYLTLLAHARSASDKVAQPLIRKLSRIHAGPAWGAVICRLCREEIALEDSRFDHLLLRPSFRQKAHIRLGRMVSPLRRDLRPRGSIPSRRRFLHFALLSFVLANMPNGTGPEQE